MDKPFICTHSEKKLVNTCESNVNDNDQMDFHKINASETVGNDPDSRCNVDEKAKSSEIDDLPSK